MIDARIVLASIFCVIGKLRSKEKEYEERFIVL